MSLEPNTIDILRLENLKSGFESCRELTISASLEPGQHLAIYGPSGCGKSSLLKVIAGLIPAKTGTMEWQGKSVSQAELGWWRNQINYLPQDPVMGGETLLDVLLLPWQLKACTARHPVSRLARKPSPHLESPTPCQRIPNRSPVVSGSVWRWHVLLCFPVLSG